MEWEILFVFGLLGLAVVFFVTEWLRADLVALLVLVSLALSGILDVEQALAGFSSEAIIAIASLLVIGNGLVRAGVVRRVAEALRRLAGTSPKRLLLVSTAAPGLLSGFINIVAAVSVFIPAVLRLAASGNVSPGRLLMPMAATALLGANLTLIGASHNLVVDSMMVEAGLEGLGFFEITVMGAVLVAIAIVYSLVLGKLLLPKRDDGGGQAAQAEPSPLADVYDLHDSLWQVWVAPGSPASGRSLAELELSPELGLSAISLLRKGDGEEAATVTDRPDLRLQDDDILLVEGREERAQQLCRDWEGLGFLGPPQELDPFSASESELAELSVPARSALIGQRLGELGLPAREGLAPIGLWREGRPLRTDVAEQPLRAGDGLLLFGPAQRLRQYAPQPDLLWTRPPPAPDSGDGSRGRAWLAGAIFAAVILAAATGLVSVAIAALAGAGLMVLFRVLSAEQAYRAIDWRTIVLIAGMLPMGTALESTGAAQLVAEAIRSSIGTLGPVAVITAMAGLAMLLTQPLHNAAVAVVMTPTAITAAESMGADPRPFAIAVLVGASASFLLPAGHPAPLLVQKPGGYRTADFPRFGLGLALLTLVTIALLVPLIWPP